MESEESMGKNEKIFWLAKLKKLASVDIRTIDREELVDMENVKIDPELPVQERVVDYIRQIKIHIVTEAMV